MTSFGFDPTSYEPTQTYDPVKPGNYAITISESAMKPTKAGVEALALTYEIDGNEHPQEAGRKLFDNLNINHEGDKPREISRRSLSAICHATGIQARSTDDLLGGRMIVKVTVKPAEGQYQARNEVKGYKPLTDSPSPAGVSKTETAAPSTSANPRPWARK